MTVVETYAGGSKMDVADNPSGLHPKLVALISEGVAQNTTGNVFHPKVVFLPLILSKCLRSYGLRRAKMPTCLL